MSEQLQNLIESMREELRNYGELLALLEVQHEQVIRCQAPELLVSVQAINTHGEAMQAARRERTQRQRELALSYKRPPDSRLQDLLALLPHAQRGLINALVEESNELLVRVRQRARRNHVLLRRSLELMEKFMQSFCDAGVPTCNQTGVAAAPKRAHHGLHEGLA